METTTCKVEFDMSEFELVINAGSLEEALAQQGTPHLTELEKRIIAASQFPDDWVTPSWMWGDPGNQLPIADFSQLNATPFLIVRRHVLDLEGADAGLRTCSTLLPIRI